MATAAPVPVNGTVTPMTTTAPTPAAPSPVTGGTLFGAALRATGRAAFTVADNAADAFDSYGPARAAAAIMHRHFAARTAAASRDSRWSQIEARRNVDGGKLLMSHDAGLGTSEWAEQEHIARQMLPDPAWLPVAAAVSRMSASRTLNEARRRVQLAVRGWADQDTWALETVLCERLAAQLDHLSQHVQGWPSNERHPTFEGWQADLAAAAAGLRGWVERDDDETSVRLGDMVMVYGVDAPSEEQWSAAIAAETAAHLARLEAARESLRWVADNLENLWD